MSFCSNHKSPARIFTIYASSIKLTSQGTLTVAKEHETGISS